MMLEKKLIKKLMLEEKYVKTNKKGMQKAFYS
jgi:hypothetical protein